MKTNIYVTRKCISHYTRKCIMKIFIFLIQESIFLLYKKMYNNNIYFSYIRRCISYYTSSYIREINIVIIHLLV